MGENGPRATSNAARGKKTANMVRLNKIYTRTGDSGETGLSDGARVAKYSLRIAAIGAVDEANSAIGVARLDAEGDQDAMLARIQNDLFDLGADLSMPKDGKSQEPCASPPSRWNGWSARSTP